MYALALHGGAGPQPSGWSAARARQYRDALAQALEVGHALLVADQSALDAVTATVAALEDDPLFNAGRGAVLTSAGTAELDAAVMDGAALRAGAVAVIRRARNPVKVARAVMERTPHVLLAGAGADAFAEEIGAELVSSGYFLAPGSASDTDPLAGTVGAVALDRQGHLAAATSTGGISGQRPGRIGDSPLIGCGTYADERCAVSTTGHGEWFIRTVQAYDVAARMRYGDVALAEAVEAAIIRRLPTLGAAGGLIAIDRGGAVCMRFNTAQMYRATVREGAAVEIGIAATPAP
jgi:isoaspartyl peptidase/L-asparaginase-like protein (Ntn-hydrolase superfamily)